ncbi:MAG TPA: MFS transporter [Propionicimonas sp.]|uniref:MFS transporter n=1 Tax=Propionicimonas sp. TaxID=1955623 RepID=UPI002F4237EA
MFLVALAYLAFFSIALPDSTLGVAWPSMRLDFGLSTGAAGLVPPVGVAATLVATAFASRLAARFGVGRMLAASTWLSAAALVVSATSPGFAQFLVSVALMGLSGGVIDATINAYAARSFGARRINLLHAWFVVGAALSPLLVTAFVQTGLGWRWPYLVIAGLQLALGLLFGLTHARWTSPTAAVPGADAPVSTSPTAAKRGDVVLGLVAVAVQTGIESGVALWAFTFLTLGLGVDPVVAGLLASGYWFVMFAGRVGLGSLAERVGPWPVMGGAAVGLVGAGILAWAGGQWGAMAAVLLFGFAAAPVYPLLILTTAERTSAVVADAVVGYQAGASSIGAAVFPLLLGLAMDRSVASFAPALTALTVVAALLHVAMRVRVGRRREAG